MGGAGATENLLLLRKPGLLKFEHPAVFTHDADGLFAEAVRETGFNFECDGDVGISEGGQMRDHLFGNAAGVTPDASRVEPDAAVEAAGCRFGQGWSDSDGTGSSRSWVYWWLWLVAIGWRYRLALRFPFTLLVRDVWFDDEAAVFGPDGDAFPAAQAEVSSSGLVVAFGVGEGFALPCQAVDPVLNRPRDHLWPINPLQVEITGEVVDQLADGDVVPPPERHPVEFVAQHRCA